MTFCLSVGQLKCNFPMLFFQMRSWLLLIGALWNVMPCVLPFTKLPDINGGNFSTGLPPWDKINGGVQLLTPHRKGHVNWCCNLSFSQWMCQSKTGGGYKYVFTIYNVAFIINVGTRGTYEKIWTKDKPSKKKCKCGWAAFEYSNQPTIVLLTCVCKAKEGPRFIILFLILQAFFFSYLH